MSIFKENHKYLEVNDYFKLKGDGDSAKVRIISETISGWAVWKDNKPTRFTPENRPRVPKQEQKKFVAMIVWNYEYNLPQIWEITQSYLMNDLQKLESKKGSVLNYDLEITRFGEKTDTRYILRPLDPAPLAKDIKEIIQITPWNLYALYAGKEPFVDLDAGKEFADASNIA
jgi:hypothetical protein